MTPAVGGTTDRRRHRISIHFNATRSHVHLLDATMFWNPSGGVRRYVVAKRRWLREHHPGSRHTVATPMPDDAGDLRIPAVTLPGSGGDYRFPLRRGAGARLLESARPDLIEAGDPYRLAWSALDAARALEVPAVAFCHSNLERLAGSLVPPRFAGIAERQARRYAAHLYNRFDLVLAPSRAMLGHLTDWGVARAVHQPLGVDTAAFHPQRRSLRWRDALRLPANARLLVFAGRFAPEKNLQVLADAVQRLGAPYWLLAVGSGPAPPTGARVILKPPVRDTAILASMLASSDLFVHAGTQETFGLSVLEAMACGTPVVACAAEGLAELLDDSVGRAAPGNAVEDFADAIAGAFGRDRAALGTAARLRAEGYDWNRVLPVLWQRYVDLMAATPQRQTAFAMPAGGRS